MTDATEPTVVELHVKLGLMIDDWQQFVDEMIGWLAGASYKDDPNPPDGDPANAGKRYVTDTAGNSTLVWTPQSLNDLYEDHKDQIQDDLDTLQEAIEAIDETVVVQAALEATQSRDAAKISEDNAAVSASSAAADAIATADDRADVSANVSIAQGAATSAASDASAAASAQTATAADRLAVADDKMVTGTNAASTAADVITTNSDAASTAADVITTNTNAASTAADVITTNSDAASTAADVIVTGNNVISTAADAVSASNSETKAEQWATNPLNTPVEPDQYSAYHWAEVAKTNSDLTFVSGGVFKPTAGNEYPTPEYPDRDTIFIIGFDNADDEYTYTTGDLAGKTVFNTDQLLWDVPEDTFKHIPSPTGAAIVEINGKSGSSVTLNASDIPSTPTGTIVATDVQSAITELESEKQTNLVIQRSIELGRDAAVGSALIDMHSEGGANDYDFRLIRWDDANATNPSLAELINRTGGMKLTAPLGITLNNATTVNGSLEYTGELIAGTSANLIRTRGGNVNSTIRFDNIGVTTAGSDFRFGQHTNTTGNVQSYWYKGDGTADWGMHLNHKTGSVSTTGSVNAGANISAGGSIDANGIVYVDSVTETSNAHVYFRDMDHTYRALIYSAQASHDLIFQTKDGASTGGHFVLGHNREHILNGNLVLSGNFTATNQVNVESHMVTKANYYLDNYSASGSSSINYRNRNAGDLNTAQIAVRNSDNMFTITVFGTDGVLAQTFIMRPSGIHDLSGNLQVSGQVIGNYTSDERLKADIKPIENALDKVSTLRTVTYIKDDKFETGLIAQDVEKVIPEIVNELTGNKTIQQGGNELLALAMAAIKELNAKVEELEGKLNGITK